MDASSFLHYGLGLVLAPLLPGIVNRIKALFAGRQGKPLMQSYYDLAKLLQKSAVYSKTTTWVFRAGPIVGLATTLLALGFVPLAGSAPLCSFTADFFFVAYVLAMGRFATILAALDTGSAFEGMGASREATYSALVEPIFLVSLLGLATLSGGFSLAAALNNAASAAWATHWPALMLLVAAFFVVLLVENCRIPIDDPNTHLELTMIHEVMVLDHSGPDLAFIEYAAALKLWLYCCLLAAFAPIRIGNPILDFLAACGLAMLVAIAIGLVESTMARLRLVRIPQLIGLAGAFAALALILLRRGA